ncbi:sugar ABC transporter substrate-binding protein [Micromonospora sp. NPDC003816]|uniref:sugar ABC transporter substrate-binding protein n=1 Tax=Micromonospora sp. NPDC003816 TaxID=3364224 RepID=UPI001034AEF7|nr:sugar ABC transporter substrate-binding protein [Verrucosispora sp. SN26_14.1]
MKWKTSAVTATVAVLLLPSVAACGSDDSAAANGSYRVGLSDPVSSQPLDRAWGQATIAAGKHAGIDVTVLDAALDANKQVSDIDQFVAQQMDGVIVFPLAPNAVDPALERARTAGIKVLGASAIISENEPTEPVAPYDAAFNQNSDVGGARLLADHVAERLDGKGRVLGIGIGAPVPSIKFMVENYEKYVTEDRPGIEWLGTVDNATDDQAGGERAATEAIARFRGEIDAVMAYNTASAIGAAVALKRAGINGVVIVGQNGDPEGARAVQQGQIDAIVDLVPWRQGLVGVEIMRRLLAGETVKPVTYLQPELYTQETIGERLDWDEAIRQIESGELTCANGGCPDHLR